MHTGYRLMVGVGVMSALFLSLSGLPAWGQAQGGMPAGHQAPFGFVVATVEDRVSVGLGDIVVIDQGRRGGVRMGDRFVVLQDEQHIQHPMSRRALRLPREVIGEIAVTQVQENVATAVIVTSHREISTGAALMPVASGRP